MAYSIDKKTGDIVINGFENGISDDPFEGISDIRNMNINSVPKESSVNFSTAKISYPTVTGISVVSASSMANTVTVSSGTGLEARMTIVFSVSSGGGVSTNTPYYIGTITSGVTFSLYTDQALSMVVTITGTLTGTAATLNPTQLLNWAYDPVNAFSFVVDSTGYVWGNNKLTTSNNYWTFLGNTTVTNASGKGLCVYVASNGTGTLTPYLFVFRNKRIDYTKTGTIAWTYGWNLSTGGSGADAMITGAGVSNSHQALVGQDSVMYWCDSNTLGSVFQTSDISAFDPTNTATYTFNTALNSGAALTLPATDMAQCLAELGVNLMIGGILNKVYPWDRTSTSFTYPIFLAEYNVQCMVTVNTTTYIFVGNRGRIYYTNGTQAMLYKKIPDHLSGTVEPYFTWQNATSIKNQLYFGVLCTTNAQGANNNYGGVWAIDLDTKGIGLTAQYNTAIRLVNQLSYGTYAGYASVVFPNFAFDPPGTGLFIGWYDGVSNYGIDGTVSAPYTNYQSYIDTDLIPIGTFLTPATYSNVEWKLTKPLVSGEGVKVYYRLDFSESWTEIWENTTSGIYSDVHPVNFQNAQWVQFEVQTKSTATNPSYTRLYELRIRK